MSYLLKHYSNSFRFLLYIEWGLLAGCGVTAVIEALQTGHIPIQHGLILGFLGWMGFNLPQSKSFVKVLHTTIELGLIFYGTTLGYVCMLPVLYLIVVIRGCLLFELSGRLYVAGLAFILFLISQVQYFQSLNLVMLSNAQQQQILMHQLAEVSTFALATLLILQLMNNFLVERGIQNQLSEAYERLQQYALKLEDLAAVKERNRLARNIHDALGHALTALNIQLQTAIALCQSDSIKAQPFLTQAQQLGLLAMQEVRQSVGTLRADTQGDQSLESAITALFEYFRQRPGVLTSINISQGVLLPPQVALILSRILQDTLTNLPEQLPDAEIQLQVNATSNIVCLTVEDSGCGLQLTSKLTGSEIQRMRDRISELKGHLYVTTEPGSGCRLMVELPLQKLSM